MAATADRRGARLSDIPPEPTNVPTDVPAAFGRYEVLFPIARGGMAEVFAARLMGEGRFERYFAVKRMTRDLVPSERFVQAFLDEARITACIQSPHVVQVVDIGRDQSGAPFLVMELIQGVSLSALHKRRPEALPLGAIVEIGAQAAVGLDDAHAATDPRGEPLHIVHRDVSPQNILIGVDGRVRIADFGIARAKQRLGHGTQSGELKGKFGYFAPEQLRGGADRRTDVFALGIVIWELVTRQSLFHRSEVVETLNNVERLPIPRLDAMRPDVPEDFADVVEHALSRDPEERWQSAAAFSHALRRLLERGAVPSVPTAELKRIARDASSSMLGALKRASDGDEAALSTEPDPPGTVSADAVEDDVESVPTSAARPAAASALPLAMAPTDVAIRPNVDERQTRPVSATPPSKSPQQSEERESIPVELPSFAGEARASAPAPAPRRSFIPATRGPKDMPSMPVAMPTAAPMTEQTDRVVRVQPVVRSGRLSLKQLALLTLGSVAVIAAGAMTMRSYLLAQTAPSVGTLTAPERAPTPLVPEAVRAEPAPPTEPTEPTDTTENTETTGAVPVLTTPDVPAPPVVPPPAGERRRDHRHVVAADIAEPVTVAPVPTPETTVEPTAPDRAPAEAPEEERGGVEVLGTDVWSHVHEGG